MFAFEPSDNMTSREIINQARYPSRSLLLREPEKTAPALGGWHSRQKAPEKFGGEGKRDPVVTSRFQLAACCFEDSW